MIFKIQLRSMSGVTELEMKNSSSSTSIAFLMNPDVSLHRRDIHRGTSFAQTAERVAEGEPSNSDLPHETS